MPRLPKRRVVKIYVVGEPGSPGLESPSGKILRQEFKYLANKHSNRDFGISDALCWSVPCMGLRYKCNKQVILQPCVPRGALAVLQLAR